MKETPGTIIVLVTLALVMPFRALGRELASVGEPRERSWIERSVRRGFSHEVLLGVSLGAGAAILYRLEAGEIRLSVFRGGEESVLWERPDGDAVLSGTVPRPALVVTRLWNVGAEDVLLTWSLNMAGGAENEKWDRKISVFPGGKVVKPEIVVPLSSVDVATREGGAAYGAVFRAGVPARRNEVVALIRPAVSGRPGLLMTWARSVVFANPKEEARPGDLQLTEYSVEPGRLEPTLLPERNALDAVLSGMSGGEWVVFQ